MDNENEKSTQDCPSPVIMNEVQMILAEKRTSLAFLRTGIAVFLLPLSVLSILVATSKYYSFSDAADLLIPLLVLSAGLVILGIFLISRSILRISHQDKMMAKIKKKHYEIAKLIDE